MKKILVVLVCVVLFLLAFLVFPVTAALEKNYEGKIFFLNDEVLHFKVKFEIRGDQPFEVNKAYSAYLFVTVPFINDTYFDGVVFLNPRIDLVGTWSDEVASDFLDSYSSSPTIYSPVNDCQIGTFEITPLEMESYPYDLRMFPMFTIRGEVSHKEFDLDYSWGAVNVSPILVSVNGTNVDDNVSETSDIENNDILVTSVIVLVCVVSVLIIDLLRYRRATRIKNDK